MTFPKIISYNGHLHESQSSSFPSLNRAMRLGDGFFETMRVIAGHIHGWSAHVERIKAACAALHMEPGIALEEEFLRKAVRKLLEHHSYEHARLRFTFFRQGEGAYRPDFNRAGFVLEAMPLDEGRFQVMQEGVHIDIYKGLVKHRNPLSAYKLLGNHVYIQAAIWAQANKLNDALVSNDCGDVIEATSSNLFVVSKGQLITPPIESGCVGGVMRMMVINAALELGTPCYEATLCAEDLLQADELLLTNAVRGVVWVRSYGEKRYFHKMGDRLVVAVNSIHERAVTESEIF